MQKDIMGVKQQQSMVATMAITLTMIMKKKALLPRSLEQIYDNNPHKNPRIIEEGRMFFTLHTHTVDDQRQFGITAIPNTNTKRMDRIVSKQGIESKGGTKYYHQDKGDKR